MSIHRDGARWYAVHTRSKFEKIVASELAAKDIESYCPVVEELHQWADRKKMVQKPVFPGYVFARFVDGGSNRLQVQSSNGAVRVLGSANRIEPIPDVEIDSIRRMLSSGTACCEHPFLSEGARVRVRRGPLKDIEGILVRHKGDMRLVLSIALLSRSVAAEVALWDVEAVRPLEHEQEGVSCIQI